MIEIGGRTVLWHIMQLYAYYGHREFLIAAGYMADALKAYASTLLSRMPESGFPENSGCNGPSAPQDLAIEVIDTGPTTKTGGRIKRLSPWVGDQTFLLTWGDGLADVNIAELIRFHQSRGKLATLTAVRPPPRFGELQLDGPRVSRFKEKPANGDGWVNGAFFVLEPGIFDYIESDDTSWEHKPLEALSSDGQLMAYRHEGYWQCLERKMSTTLRHFLE